MTILIDYNNGLPSERFFYVDLTKPDEKVDNNQIKYMYLDSSKIMVSEEQIKNKILSCWDIILSLTFSSLFNTMLFDVNDIDDQKKYRPIKSLRINKISNITKIFNAIPFNGNLTNGRIADRIYLNNTIKFGDTIFNYFIYFNEIYITDYKSYTILNDIFQVIEYDNIEKIIEHTTIKYLSSESEIKIKFKNYRKTINELNDKINDLSKVIDTLKTRISYLEIDNDILRRLCIEKS